jgi:hypothetical protein
MFTYYTLDTVKADKFIDIDATAAVYPLSIGAGNRSSVSSRPFRVNWDGTVYIDNGVFKGNINATSGTLGNLSITGTLDASRGKIYGGTISGSNVYANYLDVSDGYIGGWHIGSTTLTGGSSSNKIILNSSEGSITGGTLKTPAGGMTLNGYLTIADEDGATIKNSYIGFVHSYSENDTIDTTSKGLGMQIYKSESDCSVMKVTTYNAGIKFYANSSSKYGFIDINSDYMRIAHGTKIYLQAPEIVN